MLKERKHTLPNSHIPLFTGWFKIFLIEILHSAGPGAGWWAGPHLMQPCWFSTPPGWGAAQGPSEWRSRGPGSASDQTHATT